MGDLEIAFQSILPILAGARAAEMTVALDQFDRGLTSAIAVATGNFSKTRSGHLLKKSLFRSYLNLRWAFRCVSKKTRTTSLGSLPTHGQMLALTLFPLTVIGLVSFLENSHRENVGRHVLFDVSIAIQTIAIATLFSGIVGSLAGSFFRHYLYAFPIVAAGLAQLPAIGTGIILTPLLKDGLDNQYKDLL